ncbi:MAG: type II toxin-antitoxin system VapB family antitoxin [Gemmatimonas sp.]|uniref:type II toxin-antitoxin system VapB family antitoxin n=1 Tax=Gemmatimonas sp. TaxID=1962908 RepID=UPI00391F8BDB
MSRFASLTEAIRVALAERLERHKRPERRYPMREAARRILVRLAALPVVDPNATSELAYDEHGLPT